METKQYINGYCVIENNSVTVNGQQVLNTPGLAFPEFAKQAYQLADAGYPKFFKMDNLSKLAFLAAGLLLKDEVEDGKDNNIALLFANSSSSLDTDTKFQEQINDRDNYYPSPAVFVYTLPNICMGEISIRYKLYTENTFFIFAHFNAEFFAGYAAVLLAANKAEKVLCGWVEFYKDSYKAFIYIVSHEGSTEHTADNITKLYHT